jgi:hypothetical protein
MSMVPCRAQNGGACDCPQSIGHPLCQLERPIGPGSQRWVSGGGVCNDCGYMLDSPNHFYECQPTQDAEDTAKDYFAEKRKRREAEAEVTRLQTLLDKHHKKGYCCTPCGYHAEGLHRGCFMR